MSIDNILFEVGAETWGMIKYSKIFIRTDKVELSGKTYGIAQRFYIQHSSTILQAHLNIPGSIGQEQIF